MKQKRRKRRETNAQSVKSAAWISCLKAALAGCVFTVILILIIALLLKWELLQETAIPMVTTGIKVLCAFLTGMICAGSVDKMPWLWSGIGGLFYVVLAFVSFSIVEKAFMVSPAILSDAFLGLVAGMVGGIVSQLRRS